MHVAPSSRAAGRALGWKQLFQPVILPVPDGFPQLLEAAGTPRLWSRVCCSAHGHAC